MRSRPEWNRQRELAWLRTAITGRLLHIPLTWHVYERTEDGEGIRKVRELPDLHLLLNRRTRQRWVRRAGQLEPTFAEIIAHPQVEQRPLDLTIAEHGA